jgi:hypothetical protein
VVGFSADASAPQASGAAAAAIARPLLTPVTEAADIPLYVVSVYCENKDSDITLFKGAFSLS